MKFVREGSAPISGDSGLNDIRAAAERNVFGPAQTQGSLTQVNTSDAYIDHLLTYLDVSRLKPLKIVVNAGNGGAGAVIDKIESKLPFTFIKVHHEPDGNLPNGVPNPLLEENRAPTSEAILANHADMGIA